MTTALQVPFIQEVDCGYGFSGYEVVAGNYSEAYGTRMELFSGSDSRSLLMFTGQAPPQFEVNNLMIFVSTDSGEYCYLGGLSTEQIGFDEWGQSNMFVVSPEADHGPASGSRVTRVIVGTS